MVSVGRAFVVVLSILAASCAGDPPTTAPTPVPAHGTPARIELSATPGVGPSGGLAAITARVQDAYGATLADVLVTFATTSGTLSDAAVATNGNGVATTTLSADPGTVKVSATTGSVTAPDVTIAMQPHVDPFVPTPGPPPPPPVDSPDLPFTVSIAATVAQAGSPTSFGMSTTGNSGVVLATWTFGDASSPVSVVATAADPSAAARTTHVYGAVGSFPVSLFARDGRGRTASATTVVNVPAAPPAPTPAFTVALTPAPTSVAVGAAVTLTAVVTPQNTALTPTTFVWNCGEGAPTTDALTTHQCTYTTSGTKSASVTASNGAVSGTGTTSVTVTPASLTVAIDPVTATAGVAATITAHVSSVGAIPTNSLTWEWDFDATTGSTFTTTETGTTPHATTETYSSSGTKTIKVRVADPLTGRTATGQRTITVNP